MMNTDVMFLDCPAYMDKRGAVRCGLPAEVEDRYTVRSSDGPTNYGVDGHSIPDHARSPGRIVTCTAITCMQT